MTDSIDTYQFSELQLKVRSHVLLYKGEPIEIPERMFHLFRILAEHSPEVVHKDQLMEALWPDRVVSDWALARLVSDARAVLQQHGESQHHLRTARGIGYALTDVTATDSSVVEVAANEPTESSNKLLIGSVAVFIAVCTLFVLQWYGPSEPSKQHVVESIAVLPLTAFSDDEELGYFADGLTEELIHQLAMLPELDVVSRNATFVFKGQAIDPVEIAGKLNVTHILEGSIRRPDNQLRVTLQLIRASDGYHEWSKVFNADDTEKLSLQETIGRSIAAHVLPAYEPESINIMREHPSSEVAYSHFIKAAALMGQDQNSTYQQARMELEQAIKVAPDYALAHAALAKVNLLLHQYARIPLAQIAPVALEHINNALNLEPELAEAHAVMGLYHTYHNNFAAAEQSYQQALMRNPNLVTAHHSLGFSFWLQNRYDEALVQFENAVRLNPMAPMSNFGLADSLYTTGQLDKAFTQFEHCLYLLPEFLACTLGLANLHMMADNQADMQTYLERSLKLGGMQNYYYQTANGRLALWRQEFEKAEDVLNPLISAASPYSDLRDLTQVKLARGKLDHWQLQIEGYLAQKPDSEILQLVNALTAYYQQDCERAMPLYRQVLDSNPSRHSGLAEFAMGISHVANMADCAQRQGDRREMQRYLFLLDEQIRAIPNSKVTLPGFEYIKRKAAVLSATQWIDENRTARFSSSQWPMDWLEKKEASWLPYYQPASQ